MTEQHRFSPFAVVSSRQNHRLFAMTVNTSKTVMSLVAIDQSDDENVLGRFSSVEKAEIAFLQHCPTSSETDLPAALFMTQPNRSFICSSSDVKYIKKILVGHREVVQKGTGCGWSILARSELDTNTQSGPWAQSHIYAGDHIASGSIYSIIPNRELTTYTAGIFNTGECYLAKLVNRTKAEFLEKGAYGIRRLKLGV